MKGINQIRKIIFTFSSILLALVLISCQKENFGIELESSKWKLVKYKSESESSFMKSKSDYFLEFTSESSIKVNLDVNYCNHSFERFTNGSFKIEIGSCTYLCCDSEYADRFRQLIPLMTKYYGKGNQLIFEGRGKMVFTTE